MMPQLELCLADRVARLPLLWIVSGCCLVLSITALSLVCMDSVLSLPVMAVLLYSTLFIVIRTKPLLVISAALLLFPFISIGFGFQLVFAFMAMLPFIAVTYRREMGAGWRALFERLDPLSMGIGLMAASISLAVVHSFVQRGIDRNSIIQVGSMLLEIVVFLVIVAIVRERGYYRKIAAIIRIPLLFFAAAIVYSLLTNGFNYLFLIKHIIIFTIDINANTPAMMLTPLVMLYLADLYKERSLRGATLYSATLVLLVIAVVLTNSRGAWVGLLCASLYMFLRMRRGKLASLQMVALGCIALMLLFALFGDVIIKRVSQTNFRDLAILGRFLLWSCALRSIVAQPLVGLGPDVFRTEKFALGYPAWLDPGTVFSSHNLYLELAVNYGIFCLIGFVLVTVFLLRAVDRMYQRESGSNAKQFLLSINAALIAILVHGFFDCGIANLGIATIMALVYGLAMSAVRRPAEMMRELNDQPVAHAHTV